MMALDLPTALEVCGKEYPIRYGWRPTLDILIACADPELDNQGKAAVMLAILYPGFSEMPAEHYQEALEKACRFIDCGQQKEGKPKPRMIDWQQDAPIIIPEINRVAGREIRLDPDIHWWTVFGWFLGIGNGTLANVLHIRRKRQKGQKLTKWEEEYYRENRALCDLRKPETEEDKQVKAYFDKWL